MPKLAVYDMFNEKRYDDAIKFLSPKLEDLGSKHNEEYWDMLIVAYLIKGGNKEKVQELLQISPSEKWISSRHYMKRANYALLINEADLALDFSNRSVELNSELNESYAFRALSNLILNNKKDFNLDIKRLKSGVSSDQFKAVACGLLGEYQEMKALLHRSFVMG